MSNGRPTLARLTPAEQLRLWRRRMGWTRRTAARLHRVSDHRWAELEQGACEWGGGELPWVGPRGLTPGEVCSVYRLRTGVTQGDVAAGVGCSRVWVCRMERGLADATALLCYWEQ